MHVRHPQQGLTRLEIYAIIAIIVALLTYIIPVPQVAPRQNPVVEQKIEEIGDYQEIEEIHAEESEE